MSWRNDPRVSGVLEGELDLGGRVRVRLAVQLPLYLAGAVVALGIAKTAMGVPIFPVAIWLSYLVLRGEGGPPGGFVGRPYAPLSCSEFGQQEAMPAERIERSEIEYLWERATRSYPAIRREPKPDSELRTPFQRDRDRIVHSKAFRRLKHKTQVFIAPEGDHYRTRPTHSRPAGSRVRWRGRWA